MKEQTIVIARRYCGPPNSANGGYASGRLAAFIDGPAEVTLHRPPPLDAPLVVEMAANTAELRDAGGLIATAKAAELAVALLDSPGPDEAADAAGRTFDPGAHALPTCFVCGPLRDHGDGLRLHVGPLDPADGEWNGVLAAPWVPAENLADEDGTVRSEFVWAALDCPTGYACGSPAGIGSILLGRQAVCIERRPRAGEHCVVASVYRGRERRKHFADSMLFGAGGERFASCRAIWIEVPEAVQKGAA